MLYNRRIVHTRAPLRISFIGGGTDFPEYYERKEGHVISTTIDAFVYVTIKDMFDTNVRIHHSEIETEPISSRISHAYSRVALEEYGLFKGVEVVITADVMTTGSGLGASSSLMSALILGCAMLRNQAVGDPHKFAQTTYALEKQAGTTGGIQDQYAVVFGGLNSISFNASGIHVEPLQLSRSTLEELEACTFLVFTNLARSSEPIQSQLVQTIRKESKERYLEDLYKLSLVFKKELLASRLDTKRLGEILHESWEMKKAISPESTNLYIDELYDFLRKNGVVGGKVAGAGGGGFFLALARNPDAKRAIMHKLYPNYIGMDVKFHPKGTEVLWKNF